MSRAWPFLFLVLAVGCGRGGGEDLVPVTGTVKFADGSEITFESGRVAFEPTTGGRPATGDVDEDGSFTMMTLEPGDGVKPGAYKVILQLWKSYRDQIPAVPDKYQDASTTPLEATVDDDHAHFDFKVEK